MRKRPETVLHPRPMLQYTLFDVLNHCSYFLGDISWGIIPTSLFLEKGKIVLSFTREFWTRGNPGIELEPSEQATELTFGFVEIQMGFRLIVGISAGGSYN